MSKAGMPLTLAVCLLTIVDCHGTSASPRAPSLDSYVVGSRPRSVAVADLNHDGRRDVVVGNAGDGTLTVLVGAGDGRLSPMGSAIPCGNDPSFVDAVDLDKDGDADLVVANHETSNITVLLNDGEAKFSPAPGSPFNSGARPHVHGVATGDFDGDGWCDVAVESADTREIRLFRGGPRGLGEAVPIPVGTMPYHRLGAADMTGDGIPDLLVPGNGNSTVFFLQRANGGLAKSSPVIAVPDKPFVVLGGDVSGDGRNDVIAVHAGAVSVLLATSRGFSPSPGSPFSVAGASEAAIGDLDGDGITDIAIAPWDGDEITIIEGGAMTVRKVRACRRPIGLAIADLDGDKRGELLATCSTGNRLVVLKWSGAK